MFVGVRTVTCSKIQLATLLQISRRDQRYLPLRTEIHGEMLTHRGFSAWIVSEGIPIPEYLVAVDTKLHQISCWIPSEEGKVYQIRLLVLI
jgi:hypothetical protein